MAGFNERDSKTKTHQLSKNIWRLNVTLINNFQSHTKSPKLNTTPHNLRTNSTQTHPRTRRSKPPRLKTPQKVLNSTQLHTTSVQMHPHSCKSKPLSLKTPREIRPLHAVATHLASSRTLHDQEVGEAESLTECDQMQDPRISQSLQSREKTVQASAGT